MHITQQKLKCKISKKDNYEYEPNGRGWYLKDNMDESIRRTIRKVLH